MENTPRRNSLDKLSPAELSIHEAITDVEELGADKKLTDAIVHLTKAKDLVGDFIDMEIAKKAKVKLSRSEAGEKMKELADLLLAKAAIDMHNEISTGLSGYEHLETTINKYSDPETGEFLTDKWIEENL